MSHTRRDCALALASLALVRGAESKKVESKTWRLEDLPVKENKNGSKSRAVLDASLHTGQNIEMHITELLPGQMPHPPHHHAHEEMVLVQSGTLEVTISGKASRIGPGGSAIVASNEEHGWKNVGDTNALYFVMAFGKA
jgi:quercetin dioxygenase-like cupin family protein